MLESEGPLYIRWPKHGSQLLCLRPLLPSFFISRSRAVLGSPKEPAAPLPRAR